MSSSSTAEVACSDAREFDSLFGEAYTELRRLAQRELRRGSGVTLSPTTLLHETFLSIAEGNSPAFKDSRHLLSYAARAMRGLIIDDFRRRQTIKRGHGFEITSLPTDLSQVLGQDGEVQLDRLGDALESLAQVDERLAECVDLRFFCGLSFAEIARLRDVSERTVYRDWDKARVLLDDFLRVAAPA